MKVIQEQYYMKKNMVYERICQRIYAAAKSVLVATMCLAHEMTIAVFVYISKRFRQAFGKVIGVQVQMVI